MAVKYSTDSSSLYNELRTTTQKDNTSKVNIEDFYEIRRCVKWIRVCQYKKVALQFPDDLLHDAAEVALSIQRQIEESEVYVLADTSYGSCCVDEIAAEHVASDALIHFGASCLSPSTRLPVLYVYGKPPVDFDDIVQQFQSTIPDHAKYFILMYDVVYSHSATVIYEELHNHYPNLIQSSLIIPGVVNEETPEPSRRQPVIVGGARKCFLHEGFDVGDYSILYIGHEGPTLSNLLMTLHKCEFFTYDPSLKSLRHERLNVNKALQRRFYMIERARDSHIVGILIGTLGVSGYLEIIMRIKEVAKHAGKRTYTIVVGRLNPSKLANFPEVDVFVLVACSENSLLDSKEFYRPIITPFEFEMACNEEREWTGECITDFHQLLPGAQHYKPLSKVADDGRTSVSLITGKINYVSVSVDDSGGCEGSLIASDNTIANIHQNAGGEFLLNRSWHGLEQNLGKDDAATVQVGKSGVASGYEHESQLLK